MEKPMRLECDGLKYTYPGSEAAVIDNLCFSMTAPGFNAVFGPSGVGKTSLAKLLVSQANLPESRISTSGLDRILYSYNQERLPGWSSTGNHLNKVCPPGKEGLKKKTPRDFQAGAGSGRTLFTAFHGSAESHESHPLPAPGV